MKVVFMAYPHVELTGEIELPDGLTDEEVIEYIRCHPREPKYDYTPRTVSFSGNDFWVDTVGGRKVRQWESFE